MEPQDEEDVGKRIAQYIAIREHIAEIKRKHEEELLVWEETKNLLSAWIMAFLERTGQQSAKAKDGIGTAYATTRYTASVADGGAFMEFVKSTQQFELLERRANVTAVRDYVEAHKVLPPGVNLSSQREIGVRRGKTRGNNNGDIQ